MYPRFYTCHYLFHKYKHADILYYFSFSQFHSQLACQNFILNLNLQFWGEVHHIIILCNNKVNHYKVSINFEELKCFFYLTYCNQVQYIIVQNSINLLHIFISVTHESKIILALNLLIEQMELFPISLMYLWINNTYFQNKTKFGISFILNSPFTYMYLEILCT